METAAYILIVILSVTLVVFLLALTVLVVQLTKISRKVRTVAERAEDVAENVASASKYFKPAVMSGSASKFVERVITSQRGKHGKK